MIFTGVLQVLTYPTILDRGVPVLDYSATPTEVPITGVDIQPGASTELTAQRREGVAVRWSVFVPVTAIPDGVTLDEGTVVRVLGDVCQVDGRPMAWVSGSRLDHYVLLLAAWNP